MTQGNAGMCFLIVKEESGTVPDRFPFYTLRNLYFTKANEESGTGYYEDFDTQKQISDECDSAAE